MHIIGSARAASQGQVACIPLITPFGTGVLHPHDELVMSKTGDITSKMTSEIL